MNPTIHIRPSITIRAWLKAFWALLCCRPLAFHIAFPSHLEIASEQDEYYEFVACAFYDGLTVGPPSDDVRRKAVKMRRLQGEMGRNQ